MARYFITGTGTDIGKTWLSCALLCHWRAAGVTTTACKPVMSGVDAENLTQSDAGQLLLAMGREVSADAVAEISPWRFAAPLSPDMAAAAEGRAVPFDELVTFSRGSASADGKPRRDAGFAGVHLIEGVGGVMAPLDARHTVLDWMVQADLPVVLVTGSYLGAMSHALTALRLLQLSRIEVAALVINESPGSGVGLAATASALRSHCGAVPLVTIPRGAAEAGVTALAHILQASPNAHLPSHRK